MNDDSVKFIEWASLITESTFTSWPLMQFFDGDYVAYSDLDNFDGQFIKVATRWDLAETEVECRVTFARLPASKTRGSIAKNKLRATAQPCGLEEFFAELSYANRDNFPSPQLEANDWVVFLVECILPGLDFQKVSPRITLGCGQIGKLGIFNDARWNGPAPLNNEKLNRKLSNLMTQLKNDLES